MSPSMLEYPIELLCIFTATLSNISEYTQENISKSLFEKIFLTQISQLEIEKGYYLDGEDAWMMRKFLEDKYNLGLDEKDTIELEKQTNEEAEVEA